jgi:TolB-like protein
MMRALLCTWICLCAATVYADKPQPQRLLMQRLEPVGVPDTIARSLEEGLVFELGRREAIEVVSPAELEQTVEHARLETELGCDMLDECMLEVQRKLRVHSLIAGKVSRLGSTYVIAVSLLDVETKGAVKRAAKVADNVQDLLGMLPAAVDELLGKATSAPEFRLQPGQQLKLAVMPLSGRGVAGPTADAMTQILASTLNQIEGISVISRDDIRAMLDKVATEGELGCTENLECIIEIGAALGLAKLVTGTVGKLQDTYVIAMQLIDTRKAAIENRVLETFEGDADELRHAVKLAACQLVGVDYMHRLGGVDFMFNVANASVRLGDRALQLVDHRLDVHGLAPGRYSLRVMADPSDYYPLQTDVYVAPGADNVRTLRLSDRPTPWYGKWWVWTVGGAVLAATVTSAIIVASDEPSSGSGQVIFIR